MIFFIWFILFTLLLDVVIKVVWIASDTYPKRTRAATVCDAFIAFSLAVWAACLLAISA